MMSDIPVSSSRNEINEPTERTMSISDLVERRITSLEEALQLLKDIPDHGGKVEQLIKDFEDVEETKWDDIPSARADIYNIIKETSSNFIRHHAEIISTNTKLQYLLNVSFEHVITNAYQDSVLPLIYKEFTEKDQRFCELCLLLSKMQVTADQLGAPENFVIPYPFAIVELASLDNKTTPGEKLSCLRTTFDLILAELKSALIDVIALTSDDDIPIVNTSEIIPILMFVIVKAKPLHLYSSLYFMENFQWTLLPSDDENESLLAFKKAVDKLEKLKLDKLPPRSEKVVFPDLGLNELIKISSEVEQRFSRNGARIEGPLSPVDRQFEMLVERLNACTEELNCNT